MAFGWDIEGKPIWVDKVFLEDVIDLLLNKPSNTEMNERYKNDDLIEDESHDEMSGYDTDGSTTSDENSNDDNGSVLEE